jgi:hypothetical protein
MGDWRGIVPPWWHNFFQKYNSDDITITEMLDLFNKELEPYHCKFSLGTSYYQLYFETQEDFEFFKLRSALGWK